MKTKAAVTYRELMRLGQNCPNAAANRAYYALYQAIVGELQALGRKPSEYGSNPVYPDEWPHTAARQHGYDAHLYPARVKIRLLDAA